jgi:hypothetical protein
VFLPASAAELTPDKARPSAGRPPIGNETILLVEDEPAVRKVTARILREHGYHVLQASDGIEALVVANAFPDAIHLLLTRTEDVLAYLNLALGLEEGTITSFSLVPGDASWPADTVVVGAKPAATIYELPGSPIRVEALNIANGGVDCGLFGYLAAGFNDDGALALVSGTAPVAADDDDTTTRSGRRGRRATAKA